MSEANIDEILENETAEEEGGELYEHIRIVVDKGQALERIDTFLTNHIQNISRNRVQNAAKAGNILVNEKAVKQNYKVKPNDVISIVFSYPPRETDIKPQQIPLDIVYEDDEVIVINKQAGLVVHPGHGNFDGTLLNGLAYHFEQTHQNVENKFGYLVHRIDKDTTGLLLVAKNETAQAILARQFFEHSIHRRYNALVWGDFDEDDGTIEGNIGRSVSDRRKMTVYPDGDYGKEAITHWHVLERFGYVTLNEYRLETGRTHQIRVHSQYIGHPLFNDATYGGDMILKGTTFSKYKQFIDNCFKIIPRHSLHAKELGFVHPTTGKQMMFVSELPDDMKAVLEKWRNYMKTRNLMEE
ncbi:MAG: RluA family pseudouridine synthase [Bacteroidales bacterium]|nr:RluA family pseudouridine synthase [Bacteroidales bacterium]